MRARWTTAALQVETVEVVGHPLRAPTDALMFGRFAGEEQGDAVKRVLATNNPSKRMADPWEIAKLAVYLASDDSAYVVGADFLIDGGVSAISPVGA
jgi:NAD(P)-dependent dehydrogenase (short-subunit alcohol dehydrogenase family)